MFSGAESASLEPCGLYLLPTYLPNLNLSRHAPPHPYPHPLLLPHQHPHLQILYRNAANCSVPASEVALRYILLFGIDGNAKSDWLYLTQGR